MNAAANVVANRIQPYAQLLLSHRRDLLIAIGIFGVALVVFMSSPVRPFSDSAYTFVVSESLLKHRTFALDHFALPRQEPRDNGSYVENGRVYQLEWVGNRLYYYLPPGSSVLSIPFVALMDRFGWSAIRQDGRYNLEMEMKLQVILASLLMALLGSIFYLTARLILPTLWSVLIALGGIFGTQVWNTLSGSMWSDTWGVLLIALVVWILLAAAQGKGRLRPALLATLLAWAYFVRPTNSLSLVAVGVYVLIYHRRLFLQYILSAVVWLSLFIAYSWYNFRHPLPNYYRGGRLTFEHFGEALAGNLISPARGLLVYIPFVLFVFYLLRRYRKNIPSPGLAKMALGLVTLHWMVTSAFGHWYGGATYGPRLMSGVVPWLALLAILGIRAMNKAREHGPGRRGTVWRLQNAVAGVLLLVSLVMNGIGATMRETVTWYNRPVTVDRQPSRLWDWRYPQFLAGFLRPPTPETFPPADVRIECGLRTAEPYLWYGWSETGGAYRWTDGKEAMVIFALDDVSDVSLKFKFAPFVVPGKLEQQRVNITINSKPVDTLILDDANPREYSIVLPKAVLQKRNVLLFSLPDATSPKTLRLGDDRSPLALAVYWIEIRTPNAKPAVYDIHQSIATAPLPNGGYAAEINVINPPSEVMAGDSFELRVRVRNITAVVWPGDNQNDDRTYRVRLGNHWRDASGHLLLLDDGRAALPYDLRPGSEIELSLRVTAPKLPGNYLLELDMVQERVTWFADEESRTTNISITVK